MKAGYDSFTLGDRQEGRLVLYLHKLVKCGRAHCKACPHGPYLYRRAVERVGRRYKQVERYVGKVGSEKEQAVMQQLLGRCAKLEGTPRN